MTVEGDYVTPFGYSLHYRVDGSGSEKILLVIGFSSCGAYWDPLVDAIHEKHPGRYTTCIYDQRGVGNSTCVTTEKCSTTTIARDILGMLLHLGWIGKHIPVHLVSWSMGGFGSIELVNVLLKELGGTLNLVSLTLCNTGYKFVFPAARALVPGLTALGKGILSILFGISSTWMIPDILKMHYSGNYLSDPKIYQQLCVDYAKRSPFNRPIHKTTIAIFQHLYAVLTHYVPQERMKAIRKSGLSLHAIVSSEDSLIHPTASIRLARCLGCAFSYLPGGHMSHVENTEEVMEKLVGIWDSGLSKKFSHFRQSSIVHGVPMNRTLSLTSPKDFIVSGSNPTYRQSLEDWPADFSESAVIQKLHKLIANRMDRWSWRSLAQRLRQPGRLFIAPTLILPIVLVQLGKIFCNRKSMSNSTRSLELGLLVYMLVLILVVQEVTREQG